MITLLKVILNQMSSVRRSQKEFIEELFSAMFAARSKLTFRNLSRYSNLCEKTFSRNFRKAFDFAKLNMLALVQPDTCILLA